MNLSSSERLAGSSLSPSGIDKRNRRSQPVPSLSAPPDFYRTTFVSRIITMNKIGK